MAPFADSTFGSPSDSVECTIWRCRFDSSTTSASTIPMRPTPAAARYSDAGEPRPPAPASRSVEQLQLPFLAHLRNQQVAALTRAPRGVQPSLALPGEPVALPVGEAACER